MSGAEERGAPSVVCWPAREEAGEEICPGEGGGNYLESLYACDGALPSREPSVSIKTEMENRQRKGR